MELEILEDIVAQIAEEFHHKYIGESAVSDDTIAIAVDYTSFIINSFISLVNHYAEKELNDGS
jgi:hypothetical protein